jgi:hypothetical protein
MSCMVFIPPVLNKMDFLTMMSFLCELLLNCITLSIDLHMLVTIMAKVLWLILVSQFFRLFFFQLHSKQYRFNCMDMVVCGLFLIRCTAFYA